MLLFYSECPSGSLGEALELISLTSFQPLSVTLQQRPDVVDDRFLALGVTGESGMCALRERSHTTVA